MNEYAATREHSSSALTSIRRAEAMVLVLTAFIPVIYFGAVGTPLSMLVFAVAVLLLPRDQTRVTSFESSRIAALQDLLIEGSSLRARYLSAQDLPGSLVKAGVIASLRIDALTWIGDSRARLQPYPEFAGIFDAHGGQNLGEELDGRLERLRQILHIAQASRRLNLPI